MIGKLAGFLRFSFHDAVSLGLKNLEADADAMAQAQRIARVSVLSEAELYRDIRTASTQGVTYDDVEILYAIGKLTREGYSPTAWRRFAKPKEVA